jgi:hypothetical protein
MNTDEMEQLFGKRLTINGAELLPTLPLTGGVPLESLLDPDCALAEILTRYWRGVRQARERHEMYVRNIGEIARREIRKALPIEESEASEEGYFDLKPATFDEALAMAQTEQKIEMALPFSETHPDLPEKPAETFHPAGDALPGSQFDGKPVAEAVAEVLAIAQSPASGEPVSGEAPAEAPAEATPKDTDWQAKTLVADILEIPHQRIGGAITRGKIKSKTINGTVYVRVAEVIAANLAPAVQEKADEKRAEIAATQPAPSVPAPIKAPPVIVRDNIEAAFRLRDMRKGIAPFTIAWNARRDAESLKPFAIFCALPLPQGWAVACHVRFQGGKWLVDIPMTCPEAIRGEVEAFQASTEGRKS